MGAFGKSIPEALVTVLPPGLGKKDALEAMLRLVAKAGVISDQASFRQALFDREAIRSTGFKGIAIPHVRIDGIKEPTIAVGLSASGIDFDSLDNGPVNIVVLFAMPSGSDKEYLGYLARVMTSLRTSGFTQKLLACTTAADATRLLEAGP
jgi:mannitol/fructose-specific phosphotransferase system IIA component (Ntr-type)